MLEIKVKYFTDIEPIKFIENKSDWYDLRSAEEVEMKAGEIVPADIRLISSNNFSCDESSLTGESV